MKVEKFKVLLYLKKSGLDKSGKAPIMGRITVNRTMAQFGCKLSCTPELWNPRESRLNGKSKEAVETNAKIEKLLLAVNSAFDSLLERKQEFDAAAVKDMFQGSMDKQMTLLKQFDRINEDLKLRVGIDRAEGTYTKYYYTRQILAEFIRERFKTEDVAFGQLYERFIWNFQDYVLDEKKQSLQSARHYLALLKKVCRIAYKEGHSERYFFCNFKLPKQEISAPKALTRDNLFTDDDSNLWLKYHRKKNEYLARVKLLPEAIALLEKYKDESRETLLPVQDYRVLRANMKSLRVLAGIKTDIVYHVGRHNKNCIFQAMR